MLSRVNKGMKYVKFQYFIRNVVASLRKARLDFMISIVITTDKMTIIDIGCGVVSRLFDAYVPANWEITGTVQ